MYNNFLTIVMKKYLMIMCAAMAVLTACSNKKSAEAPVETVCVEGTLTKTLADGTQVTWIKDNQGDRLMPRALFGAPDSLYEALGIGEEGVPASVSTYLMKCGDDLVLFDAGLGVKGGGQLLALLDSLGVAPADIDYLYISHFHGDHIGGMICEGQPVFTNAKVYVGKVEYEAWMNMPEERNGQVREIMGAYQSQLNCFEFGDTLPCGVLAIDAVGHTPGHTVFQKGELLIIADLMHGAALQMQHPEFNANFDMDKEQAAASRARILEYVKNNNLTMAGMHLPAPGFWE